MCQTATLDTLWWSLARTTIPIARDKAIRTNLFKGKQRFFSGNNCAVFPFRLLLEQ